jgi:HlyD family secretion protein
MRLILAIVIVIGLVACCAAYYTVYVTAEPTMGFKTVAVEHGDLIDTIKATGTVEPEEVVDVGAQVMGRIKDFGLDPSDPEGKKRIDYCSTVHEGTVLAYIDDSMYKAQWEQAQATTLRAKADVLQFKAKLLQTERDRKRAEELRSIDDIPGTDRPIKGIAESDYDLAVANHEMAKASVAVAEATRKQSEAALDMTKTNLDYTIIKSPVEGMIIARRVNIGQTVVASLNAPSIFLIAKDLRKMQVWAWICEADIGRIRSRKDMPVKFTVDAYPDQVFYGKVLQVRLDSNMTQNVVTYTVVVGFDNSDLKLIPYLTANLKFEVEKKENVLLVPTAALRWKPKTEQIVPEMRDVMASNSDGKSGGSQPAGPPAAEAKSVNPPQKTVTPQKSENGRLWVVDGKYVRPMQVTIGATDETMTEVSGDDVKDGMKVVVGVSKEGDVAADDTTNPFGPPRFMRGNRKTK